MRVLIFILLLCLYPSAFARNPFIFIEPQEKQEKAANIAPKAATPNPPEDDQWPVLQGMASLGKALVLINGEWMQEGETWMGYRIQRIMKDGVWVSRGKEQKFLTLTPDTKS